MQQEPSAENAPEQRGQESRLSQEQESAGLTPFLARIQAISGLTADMAARAAALVLCALEERISEGEAAKLEAEVPPGLRELIRDCEIRLGAAADKFGRGELFRRIAYDLGMTAKRVGPVVTGVFTALRETVSAEEAAKVANQLPADLKILWSAPSRSLHAPPIPGVKTGASGRAPVTTEIREMRRESRTLNTYLGFVERLADDGRMNDELAECAAISVLCRLEQRLSADERKDLNSQLPSKLQELLVRCPLHTGKSEKFGLRDFYERVAEDLQLSLSEAVPLVQFVFREMRSLVSEGEFEDVGAQLPKDIAEVWLGQK